MENRNLFADAPTSTYGAIDSTNDEPTSTGGQVNDPVQAKGSNMPTQQRKTCAVVWLHTSLIQMRAAGPAALILITGGMNIAWSCGFANQIGFTKNTHLMICWYIAAIIGVFTGAFITDRITKKPIYMFSGFLVLIAGLFFVTAPHAFKAIAAARYINGFAVGLVFVPMLVLIGELVDNTRRGWVASLLETGAITLGIALQIIFAVTTNNDNANGILGIILGIIAILLSYLYVIESPTYYLIRHDEGGAMDSLRKIQNPTNGQLQRQMEQQKRYLEINETSGGGGGNGGCGGWDGRGLAALAKLCLYRGLIALTFSSINVDTLKLASFIYAGPYAIWPYILFACLLFGGALVAALLMDVLGRKRLLLMAGVLAGALAIAVGSICSGNANIYLTNMKMLVWLLLVLALFAGSFRSSSSAYLTEAFPLNPKPFYIATVFAVELLVLLIIGACKVDAESAGGYFISYGILYLLFFIVGIIFLPETKKLSLYEAQDRFKNSMYISL